MIDFNAAPILSQLKDFQLKTAEYVFRRMYLDPDKTRRFLIADEVGLGKTLVARGLIAKVVEHLQKQKVKRIDIVYICSNGDIARQNIDRLNITGGKDVAIASRITLLPIQLSDLENKPLNFVSFTPGTSFELKSRIGISDERVVLYKLLKDAWQMQGVSALNVLQGNTGTVRFRELVDTFDDEIEESIAHRFTEELKQRIQQEKQSGQKDLRTEFDELCVIFSRADKQVASEGSGRRNKFVGQLRGLLAKACLQALEPDLIILDEFQRFKHLLNNDDDNEASRLAMELFNYSDAHSEARVLLLSATPYKMYTLDREEDDDHYQDFLETIRFLQNDAAETEALKTVVSDYRHEILRIGTNDWQRLRALKEDLQNRLRRVMVRTERLATSSDRDGMLTEVISSSTRLEPQDLESYLALEDIAELLQQGNTMEYWKSAPYLLNFMKSYQLKQAVKDVVDGELDDPEIYRQLADILTKHSKFLLSWPAAISQYNEVDPGNARLRSLMDDTVGKGAWRLLWLPPSLPYYQLAFPFDDPNLAGFTKRLVFSSWQVVPKAISILLSYETERRMFRSFDSQAINDADARKQRGDLFRFSRSQGRLTGMPILGLLYPSTTLAKECDPLTLLANPSLENKMPSIEKMLDFAGQRIENLLKQLTIKPSLFGNEDERWYWAAPILLDMAHYKKQTVNWFSQEYLELIWAAKEDAQNVEDEDSSWAAHVAEAHALIEGKVGTKLGRFPSDLVSVLAHIALAGFGVTALRSLSRLAGGANALTNQNHRNHAGQVAWSFLTLFNLPETTAMLRGLNKTEPYWRRVLEYCVAGGLQSALDEYAHVLYESLGLFDKPPDETIDDVAVAMRNVITLRTSTPDADEITVDSITKKIVIENRGMRCRFAQRFGDEKSESGSETTRADQVRAAFNSPFWPFVLTTTSIGQEGLDFHPYCHMVVHWNLPSNPVDLEQREGRVHRYKGHAVRKNLASVYTIFGVLKTMKGDPDPWRVLFNLKSNNREPGESELVPYWIYPIKNGATIERQILALPLSRDLDRLIRLRQSLTVYRMVFGQNRQEDLLVFLNNIVDAPDRLKVFNELQINLNPPEG